MPRLFVKECEECGGELPDHRVVLCTQCDSPEKRTERKQQYMQEFLAERKKYITELKEASGCIDCGQSFPAVCLDFDHRDPTEKIANVSYLIKASWKKLKEEIAKCDIVCANCHRLRTFSN